jgi:DNA modification methylase
MEAAAMSPYFSDEQTTLYHGDSLAVLSTLPDQSVNCCVTSPPYFGLRDYGEEGQYGLESSPAEYIETMRAVFAEVRRVLADDGTLWLNVGDSYYSGRGAATGQDAKNSARRFGVRSVDKGGADWAKPKDLLGIPWRMAFALQDDGWTLRNDIVWAKPNAMPESVRDRLSCTHEHVFMLAKARRYWFELDAIKVDATGRIGGNTVESRMAHAAAVKDQKAGRRYGVNETSTLATVAHDTRNPGDVWTMPPQPFADAHFAVMPQLLAERAILAGCKPGGTVLDPFSGSGTTGLAAAKHGRKYVGIDINADYLDLSLRTRLAQPGLDFGEETA